MPFPPVTQTKTFTVTNTKLLVATACLLAATGLAFMAVPPTDMNDNSATEESPANEQAATGDQNAAENQNAATEESAATPPNNNAEAPSAPRVLATPSTTLQITIGDDNNSPSTTYAIREETSRQFVQANGSLKASPDYLEPYGAAVYQTKAEWNGWQGGTTVHGLKPNIQYIFNVDAKNDNDVHSGWGPETNRYTFALPPTPPLISKISDTSFQITLGKDNNPSWTTYQIMDTQHSATVQDDGTLPDNQANPSDGAYKTAAEWAATPIRNLKPNTTYKLRLGSFNGDKLLYGYIDFTVETKPAPCATVTLENGAEKMVMGLPILRLSDKNYGGPASPQMEQAVLAFDISADSGKINQCQEIRVDELNFIVSSTFSLGRYDFHMDSPAATTLAHGIVGNGNQITFKPMMKIAAGDTRHFYLTFDTSQAQAKDSLSLTLSAPVEWKVADDKANAIRTTDGLPLPWTSFSY